MNAAGKSRRLIRVTSAAHYLLQMVWVRIVFDVRMTIATFQRAVNALAKLGPIHRNAVPRRVLHRLVGMASQAIRFGMEPAGTTSEHQSNGHRQHPSAHYHILPTCRRAVNPAPHRNFIRTCGFRHLAVYFLHEQSRLPLLFGTSCQGHSDSQRPLHRVRPFFTQEC